MCVLVCVYKFPYVCSSVLMCVHVNTCPYPVCSCLCVCVFFNVLVCAYMSSRMCLFACLYVLACAYVCSRMCLQVRAAARGGGQSNGRVVTAAGSKRAHEHTSTRAHEHTSTRAHKHTCLLRACLRGKRDLFQRQKEPCPKGKRDLFQRQKRPISKAKETSFKCKRDLFMSMAKSPVNAYKCSITCRRWTRTPPLRKLSVNMPSSSSPQGPSPR